MVAELNRREWLQTTAAAAVPLAIAASPGHLLFGQDPKRPKNLLDFAGQSGVPGEAATDCVDCAGLGFLPLKSRKPYVHIEGQPPPKAADAVPHRYCPKCRPEGKEQELIDEQTARFKTALDAHKKWEKETGYQLTRIETRHVVVHAQMPLAECIRIGQGFENLAAHLQELTGTMELTNTRPESYEVMCLLGKDSYEHFRTVMEKLYTVEERGPSWSIGRGLGAFDHQLLPFFYESLQSLKQRPPAHGVAFMGGRRQLSLLTCYKSPRWLSEGFAEYSEFVALKSNLWHTVYNQNPGPEPGDWVSQVRQLAVAGQLRPWPEQMERDLQDWDVRDYLQTFGMVAFLIQTQPKKFLAMTRKLRAGVLETPALEEAFEKPIAKLDPECTRWLAAGGR